MRNADERREFFALVAGKESILKLRKTLLA
jgi:hypothetical protein